VTIDDTMASDNPPVVRTRFLVISDTHGFRYLPDTKPVEPIDVVIHCGDITGSSQLAEFQAAIQLLHQIPAPLKLIIPGNHDFTLDEPTYRHLLHKWRKRRSLPNMLRSHGQPGDARRLFDEAAKHNTSESTVLYLDEGTRT
jgi:predicted phosphodiesterase